MKTQKTLLFLATLGAAFSAQAQEIGKVISSTPMIQQVAVPRQVCSENQVVTPGQKSGAGTLALNGSNTYTGGTSVSAGQLALSGSNNIIGAVSVNGGILNVQNGGALNYGVSAATDRAGLLGDVQDLALAYENAGLQTGATSATPR